MLNFYVQSSILYGLQKSKLQSLTPKIFGDMISTELSDASLFSNDLLFLFAGAPWLPTVLFTFVPKMCLPCSSSLINDSSGFSVQLKTSLKLTLSLFQMFLKAFLYPSFVIVLCVYM